MAWWNAGEVILINLVTSGFFVKMFIERRAPQPIFLLLSSGWAPWGSTKKKLIRLAEYGGTGRSFEIYAKAHTCRQSFVIHDETNDASIPRAVTTNLIDPLTVCEESNVGVTVLVSHTPTCFPTNICYTPLGNMPLQFMPGVLSQWGDW